RLDAWRALRGRRRRDRLDLRLEAVRARHFAGERGALAGQALEHAGVRVAQLVHELGAAGDDVGGAGMDADHAEVGDAHIAAARGASKPAPAIASTSRVPSTAAISSIRAASSRPQKAREPKRLP